MARQIGNIQCNINRLQIVTGLAGLQNTLKTLASQSSSYAFPCSFGVLATYELSWSGSDTETAASVQSVQESVTGAQGAIGVIAKALFTGQAAPAAARDQVAGNLTAAQTTLSSISS